MTWLLGAAGGTAAGGTVAQTAAQGAVQSGTQAAAQGALQSAVQTGAQQAAQQTLGQSLQGLFASTNTGQAIQGGVESFQKGGLSGLAKDAFAKTTPGQMVDAYKKGGWEDAARIGIARAQNGTMGGAPLTGSDSVGKAAPKTAPLPAVAGPNIRSKKGSSDAEGAIASIVQQLIGVA